MNYYAIIVGGGAGLRMGHQIPKQFLPLNGKPVLMHTLCAFHKSGFRPEIILVLNQNQHAYWQQLCVEHNFTVPHRLIDGGEQRFHSVRNGLMAIRTDGIVAVHDGVRPLASARLIDTAYEKALLNGNAIAAVGASDTIRYTNPNGTEVLDRNKIMLVQTPQTFQLEQLRKAYQQHYSSSFTDDASVVEKAGFQINLLEGERHNFKITFPEDLELASFLINKKSPID